MAFFNGLEGTKDEVLDCLFLEGVMASIRMRVLRSRYNKFFSCAFFRELIAKLVRLFDPRYYSLYLKIRSWGYSIWPSQDGSRPDPWYQSQLHTVTHTQPQLFEVIEGALTQIFGTFLSNIIIAYNIKTITEIKMLQIIPSGLINLLASHPSDSIRPYLISSLHRSKC